LFGFTSKKDIGLKNDYFYIFFSSFFQFERIYRSDHRDDHLFSQKVVENNELWEI